MDTSTVIAGVLMCCTAVFFITSTSIARKCYNDNKSYSDGKGKNSSYITYMLVLGACCVLTSFGIIYLGVKHGDKVQGAVAGLNQRTAAALAQAAVAPPKP